KKEKKRRKIESAFGSGQKKEKREPLWEGGLCLLRSLLGKGACGWLPREIREKQKAYKVPP
ncbi:hypothetical protein C5B41_17255, partial [Acinetobacter ursingii]|uniref:hypothetical protein n=1 Tax=Acinetobacter ursingii TaxID=108980 RepID=UPI000D4C24F0